MEFSKLVFKERKSYSEACIYYSYKKKKKYFQTGVKVTSEAEKKNIHKHPNFEQQIKKKKERIEKIIKDYFDETNEKPEVSYVIKEFEKPFTEEKKVKTQNLLEFWEEFKKYKVERRFSSENSFKKYNSLKASLESYEEARKLNLKFSDLDYNFWKDFINYLMFEKKNRYGGKIGIGNNTLDTRIKNFKEYLKYCSKKEGIKLKYDKIIEDITDVKSVNKVSVYKAKKLALSKDELAEFIKFPVKKMYQKTKDFFLVTSLTGCAIGDAKQIKRESIINNWIDSNRIKTTTQFKCELHPIVKAILEKYDYNLNISDPVYNRYLKVIFYEFFEHYRKLYEEINENDYPIEEVQERRIGKNLEREFVHRSKLISSHSGRYTYILCLIQSGMSVDKIADRVGHSSISTTLDYAAKGLNLREREAEEVFNFDVNYEG